MHSAIQLYTKKQGITVHRFILLHTKNTALLCTQLFCFTQRNRALLRTHLFCFKQRNRAVLCTELFCFTQRNGGMTHGKAERYCAPNYLLHTKTNEQTKQNSKPNNINRAVVSDSFLQEKKRKKNSLDHSL